MEETRFKLFEKSIFNAPSEGSIKIWRYMDFTKYVSLLNSKALYLTRCDKFSDPFEGSATKHEVSRRLEQSKATLTKDAVFTPAQASDILGEVWKKYQRQYTFINCWHMNEHESVAMWKLYAKSDEAIAIQTTFDKLRNCLPESCHIGQVKYIDHHSYVKEEDEKMFPVMYKRKSFEHERELRVCYVDSYDFIKDVQKPETFFKTDNPHTAEIMPVELQNLIDSVYVAPNTPHWFSELVKDITGKFGFEFPIRQSHIDDSPLF